MALTYVTITHTYKTPGGAAAAGTVEFKPVKPFDNGFTTIARTEKGTLSAGGVLSILLAANTDPATTPVGTTYEVTEKLTGQTAFTYFVQIPHDQGGSLDLHVLAGWVGFTGGGGGDVSTINGEGPDGAGNVVLSASDVGAQPANVLLSRLSASTVAVTYASSVTLNASQGSAFRCVATGNLTLADITNGVDSQRITVRVKASGADRMVSFPSGGPDAVTIPSGTWWLGRLLYDATDDAWIPEF